MPRHDQVVRLLTIAQALAASRRGVALRQLAERHGWRVRSLYRDVEALERAGFPVVHDEGRYRLVDGWSPPSGLGLDAEELLALFVARQLAGGLRATSLGRALERLWGKLTTAPGRSGVLVPPGGAPWLSVRAPAGVDYAAHHKTVATLERAVRERVVVSCRYRALSTGEVTARVLEPGELYWDPGLESLYLVAWCRLRQDVRVFAVHRFRAVALGRERFAPRPGVSSRAALRDAFRVWRCANVHTVRVRFAAEVAEEIRERRWHRSQRVTVLPGGGVEMCCEVAGLEEIERWVLGWGAAAEVVEPRELAQRVRTAARGVMERLAWGDKGRGEDGQRRGRRVPGRRCR